MSISINKKMIAIKGIHAALTVKHGLYGAYSATKHAGQQFKHDAMHAKHVIDHKSKTACKQFTKAFAHDTIKNGPHQFAVGARQGGKAGDKIGGYLGKRIGKWGGETAGGVVGAVVGSETGPFAVIPAAAGAEIAKRALAPTGELAGGLLGSSGGALFFGSSRALAHAAIQGVKAIDLSAEPASPSPQA